MKKTLIPLIFLLSLSIFSCNMPTPQKNLSDRENQTAVPETKAATELVSNDVSSINRLQKQEKTKTAYYEYFFVIAKSGLNYRESPKGKVIGMFYLNTNLKVIKKTSLFEQIIDGDSTINGEWVGVEKGKDTVYVFNAYLSESPLISNVKIFQATPFYRYTGSSENGFINLSEVYFKNEELEKAILQGDDLPDTIILNAKQRALFLRRAEISESDSVYLYDVKTGDIFIYKVNDLPALARINTYFNENEYEKEESDFEFGFDLGKTYKNGYDNFVFIGKENPFIKGKLKPIVWKEIDLGLFKRKFNKIKEFEPYLSRKTSMVYLYQYDNFDFYFLDKQELIVVDVDKKSIVYSDYVHSDEGSTPTRLVMEDDAKSGNEQSQWTGILFKNKPPVIFGFYSYSFSCEGISFLNRSEPPLGILCDCRH